MQQIELEDLALWAKDIAGLVSEGRQVTIAVSGRSMRPFIEHKLDKVVLVKAETVNKGDVVLAHTVERGCVLHRVASINNGRCTLRGDGNLDTEHCETGDVIAKVSAVIRKAHRFDVDGRVWRAYSFLWMKLLPLRRYLLALYRLCKR